MWAIYDHTGHYVPAVGHRIYEGNLNKEGEHINLKGVSIGNGLTDPEIQYAYYYKQARSTNNHTALSPGVCICVCALVLVFFSL